MALKFVTRVFYQGKVCSYFKKNNTVLRYKIEKRYLTSKYRVKDTYKIKLDSFEIEQDDEV